MIFLGIHMYFQNNSRIIILKNVSNELHIFVGNTQYCSCGSDKFKCVIFKDPVTFYYVWRLK